MNSIKKLNSFQVALLIFFSVIAVACILTGVLFVGIQAFPLIFTAKLTPNAIDQTPAHTLSAKDVFFVTAVDVAQKKGYTVTSAVCEVVSPERFRPTFNVNGTPTTVDVGIIVFHAFRITGPGLNSDVAVLFYSNHTAADGNGIVATVNDEAKKLFPDITDGATLSYPLTMNTTGAQSALVCAQQAGKPPSLDFGGFDYEAWRQEAIKKFGPEQTYSDGSKDDYVRTALGVCKYKAANPSVTYDAGTFSEFIVETFCPHVSNP